MLTPDLRQLLLKRISPFIMVGTSHKNGESNVAPKLLFKYGRGAVYLVDVPFGQTWENLKENSNLAMSFIDEERLKAYRLKGTVKILDSDHYRAKYYQEIDDLLNRMIVDRIVSGGQRGKSHGNFIANIPQDFVVFKVSLTEVVEYGLEDIKTRKRTKKRIYRTPPATK